MRTAACSSITGTDRICTLAVPAAAAPRRYSTAIFCAVGQILIDRTRLTPARILTGYVVAGVFLSAVGLYQPLADWGGAGATVPLTGFGHALAKGVEKAVAEQGWLGVLTGGLSATAGGITTAVVSAVVIALIFKPGDKR